MNCLNHHALRLVLLTCAAGLAACSASTGVPPLTQSGDGPLRSTQAALAPNALPAGTSVSVVPSGSSTATNGVRDTTGRIGLMQIFDFNISSSQKVADGPRYDVVWGANQASSWRANQPSLNAARYDIFMQDAGGQDFTSHPDWVLYNCTSSGTPTHIKAYMQAGLYGTNTPVDIHNPAVISDSVHRAASAAIASGYTALAVDQVVFSNIMGGNAGAGSYGCGVWQGNTFVRRYASRGDSHWALDVVNWVKTARTILTTDSGLAPHHLKVIINHPAASTSNPLEQQLLASTDMALNEVGFTNYGYYKKSSSQFATSLNYMLYEQAHGVTALLIDKFVQSGPLTPVQREWAIGTYLMGNNGNALLFASYGGLGTGGYGREYYYSEYGTNLGAACGAATGGPTIYQRKFQNGLVVVNASTASSSASLPLIHVYSDIEGRKVTNPLPIAGTDAYVLTTTPLTGCL